MAIRLINCTIFNKTAHEIILLPRAPAERLLIPPGIQVSKVCCTFELIVTQQRRFLTESRLQAVDQNSMFFFYKEAYVLYIAEFMVAVFQEPALKPDKPAQ